MFENLIESKQKKQRTLGQTVLSVVLHVLLIVGAVKATQGVAETINNRPVDTTMVFLKPPEPPKPPPDIPKDIPPVDLDEKPFDPRDFTGKGVEGGIGTGIEGGTGPVTGEVFLEAQLDDPVQVISQPQPRYPPVLASAGITGRVELQFIVDTTGHVEGPSFKVMKTSHPAFAAPAREAILKSVFKPARFKGRPVRQLVQQAVSFKQQ